MTTFFRVKFKYWLKNNKNAYIAYKKEKDFIFKEKKNLNQNNHYKILRISNLFIKLSCNFRNVLAQSPTIIKG